MDPDTYRETNTLLSLQLGIEPPRRLDYAKSRTHGSVGIVFMGLGIAKVDQQAIPEILRDIALKALDHLGAGGLIGADDLPQVFGIKLAGEHRGVYQVAEQHGELAAFRLGHDGGSKGRWCLRQCRLRRGRWRERRPRIPQPDENAALLVTR